MSEPRKCGTCRHFRPGGVTRRKVGTYGYCWFLDGETQSLPFWAKGKSELFFLEDTEGQDCETWRQMEET